MEIYEIDQCTKIKDFLSDKISFPCSGNGTCGKCKIHITGDLSPVTEIEKQFLTPEELSQNIRLACFTQVLTHGVITLKKSTQEIEGSLEKTSFTNADLQYVCGIDIGTTTIACVIFDAKTGLKIAEVLEENMQRSYGADVISRIEACKASGIQVLQTVIRTQLSHMFNKALQEANISDIQAINKTVITGNTTMLHILEGLNPESLGISPFKVTSLFGTSTEFLHAYIPKCVSAYVGADLLCSALASEMCTHTQCSLLVDIGTNGEMCIYKDGMLTCCSVAAGPAFEGCGLSCGSPAIEGAITHVEIKDNMPIVHSLGNHMTSICGSGIISLIDILLQLDMVDETGKFTDTIYSELGIFENGKFYIQGSSVYITAHDIAQVQLAKSAICAGIYTLLKETTTSIDSLSSLYICGGFGTHLNIRSACNIGLIPPELESKVQVLGNAALAGSVNIALGNTELGIHCQEVNLSCSATFMDYYMDCMLFL